MSQIAIPKDPLKFVFIELDHPKDFLTCASTCKLWKEILSDNRFWYEKNLHRFSYPHEFVETIDYKPIYFSKFKNDKKIANYQSELADLQALLKNLSQ